MSHTCVDIITPKVVQPKHTGYVLKNGVKCIIVQDPNAKIPAASMSIQTGQLRDPPGFPGLAHFCEHMLFMGTAKFPKEDEYDNYISKNGGLNNAWTSDSTTTYFFRVADGAFEGALERFVDFFVSPSFNASAVEREVKAVHSEDEKNHSMDSWRFDEVRRSLLVSEHPRSRYGPGNLTTLWDEPNNRGDDLREAVKRFYQQYYLSKAACIAVYSSREPSEVLKVIEEPLSGMREGDTAALHFIEKGKPLLCERAQQAWVNIKTVRKLRELHIMWPVRSASSQWRCIPSAYISHILGHECDTSVLGVLKKRDMATGMSVGPSSLDDDFELFDVRVTLTIKGITHLEDVIALVYQGIGQAIAGGINEEVYAQLKSELLLSFESSEIGGAEDHCVNLSTTASLTDLTNCFVGGSVLLEDNREASLAYAQQLTPERAVVFLKWGDLPLAGSAVDVCEENAEEESEEEEEEETDVNEIFAQLPTFAQNKAGEITRFHKAAHSFGKIPSECIGRWTAALHGPFSPELALPSINPFLATDFTVFEPSSSQAFDERIDFTHGLAYIRKDAGLHKTFKTAVRLNVLSPVAYASSLNRLYTRVMRSLLADALTETSYYGELASLRNQLHLNPGGVAIAVVGPYQKLVPFLLSILEQYLSVEVLQSNEEKYMTYMESAIRSLKSQAMGQPYELTTDRFSKLNKCLNYTFEEILEAASGATYASYKQFASNYIASGLRVVCFAAGNIPSQKDFEECVVRQVEKMLLARVVPVSPPSAMPPYRDCYALFPATSAPTPAAPPAMTALDVVSFPPFNPENPNVAVLLDVYAGEETPRLRALCDCASALMQSAFFSALRTREALGYVVFSHSSLAAQGAHLLFAVQSAVDKVDGVYLLSRIIAFLDAVEASLDALCSEEELRKVAAALIVKRQKEPDSVEAEAAEVERSYLHPSGLRYRAVEIEALHAVTVADVKEFFHSVVLNRRVGGRGVAIVVNSQQSMTSNSLLNTGTCSVALPPRLPLENVEAAGADTLQLPEFSDSKATMQLKIWESIESLQEGLAVLPAGVF